MKGQKTALRKSVDRETVNVKGPWRVLKTPGGSC